MRTSPASESIKRLMNLQVVVFPEPDAPTRAMKLPLLIERERSSTAKPCTPWKDFDTWSSSISGADVMQRHHSSSADQTYCVTRRPINMACRSGTILITLIVHRE